MKKWIIIGAIVVTFAALTITLFSLLNQKSPKIDDNGESPLTTIDLVKDGETNYKVVIPATSSKTINFIKYDFVDFFKAATGIELEVITDEGLTFNEEDYYLSIGQTTIFKTSGLTATFEELGLDGLKLKRLGNTVIMVGHSEEGSMYAAYEFLERSFNFEVYAEDEYTIDQVENAYLRDFDVVEVPTFERRSVGLYPYSVNETFRNRMRQDLYNEGWILWSHSHFKILPKEIYGSNTDWYSANGTQLDLTNDEMRDEFTRVVIDLIKANPKQQYIMLGHEDINTFCDSEKCKTEIAKYTKSGVMMRFVNQVADDVQKYIDENEPGRIFYLGTFGYHQTEIAPVVLNEQNEYVAIDESVKPRPNVFIMVAPIRASNSVSYYDSQYNANTERVLKGWQALAKGQMFTWIYNKNFSNYFYPLNNFSTVKENYLILQELGSRFVYHQGNKETQAASFQALKAYVQAKLMWDINEDPEVLTNAFIENYYKDAAQAFKQYYNLVRFNFAIWEQTLGLQAYNNGSENLNTYKPELWTKDLVDQYNVLFDDMLNSIEKYRTSDPDLFEKLDFRIRTEKMTIDFIMLDFYMDEMTYSEAEALINTFEGMALKAGITVWREMYLTTQAEALITSKLEVWRNKLYNL